MSSLSQIDSVQVQPVCGMCKHFQPARELSLFGISIQAPSYCKLRASVDLPCLLESESNFAARCNWFVEEVSF
ncbi:MAG: hypothetical protein SFY66_18510 [Oculatellaceae cyanobacterium bins.114]|nr:hypothetical protein [Oculatellaceae cyanobacterium bins.114]